MMHFDSTRWFAPVLGIFGDGNWYYKEEVYPLLTAMNKRWTPKKIDLIVRRYLEYGLLRMRRDGLYAGHPQFQITEKGSEALDDARLKMIGRSQYGYSSKSPYQLGGGYVAN